MIQLWKRNRNGSPCKRPHLFLSAKLKSAFLNSWFMSDFKLIIRHLSTGKYLYCKTHSAQTPQPAKASRAAKIQLQWQHRSYFKHHLALHNYHQLLLAKESLKLIACQLKLLNPKRFIPETKKKGRILVRFQPDPTLASIADGCISTNISSDKMQVSCLSGLKQAAEHAQMWSHIQTQGRCTAEREKHKSSLHWGTSLGTQQMQDQINFSIGFLSSHPLLQ